MTSSEIRQSFLDFFREKQHTIVPSSSLMPDSPNLLFTNAGMNQFVPIFLGERAPDVSKWGGVITGGDGKPAASDTRAADTQKCIRAGGKHNDLDDVGLDTYHHTFFEMLGNWSFGDYFKAEAIAWAWELVVQRWKFPADRLYATIYQPDPGDPAERDQEAWDFWAEKFRAAGLDPAIHIVNGNKADNFWMMGETGPCGPCSELHMDLTPEPRTPELEKRGAGLVNAGLSDCIEIWNLVFIQFNANPDSTFSPLPARHVDTGMGFERVASIIQGTKNFTDFATARISNYETDIFRPIFDELEKMSGQKYASTLPAGQTPAESSAPPASDTDALQSQIDIAFRVIADHIRTLSFAIADGIQPGNTDRNYVLRRILRRAVRYGRTLGFTQPFFYKLVPVLVREMGAVFPELRAKQKHIEEVLKREEESFNKTLDNGIALFESYSSAVEELKDLFSLSVRSFDIESDSGKRLLDLVINTFSLNDLVYSVFRGALNAVKGDTDFFPPSNRVVKFAERFCELIFDSQHSATKRRVENELNVLHGRFAFKLYDEQGFPIDLTELMARERGLTVDNVGFEKLMEEQRARARAAQKKTVIELSEVETKDATTFLGYEHDHTGADVLEVLEVKGRPVVIANNSVCYAEMGGQVGDTGTLSRGADSWRIATTQKSGNTWLHFLDGTYETHETDASHESPNPGDHVTIELDRERRAAIQRHHTVTHLLHWALHEVVSPEAAQKGSFVGPEKLTFDFNSGPLTPEQVAAVERLVNEKIVENAPVSWTEVPYAGVRGRGDIMQFFGDKYGETVRVVQIGGAAGALEGYSMELCAGTHARATGELGLFKIVSEGAIAAGVRRIEAVSGLAAFEVLNGRLAEQASRIEELETRVLETGKALEKERASQLQRQADEMAARLIPQAAGDPPRGAGKPGRAVGRSVAEIARCFQGAAVRRRGRFCLHGGGQGACGRVCGGRSDQAFSGGKIIQQIAPIVGGKGGGRPEFARGAGRDAAKIEEALAHARTLL